MYHVLLRSVGKIFDSKDDYINFIRIVNECFSENGGLLGYSFFENRVHFVIMDKNKKISTVMRILTTKYSRYKKKSVFYDRFKAEPIENDTELSQALDFICRNSAGVSLENWFCGRNDKNENKCEIDTKELSKHKISENTLPVRMFDDDYKNMSKKEIEYFIKLISGVETDKIKDLSPEQKSGCIAKLKEGKWISNSRLSAILDIKRSIIAYSENKDIPKNQKIKAAETVKEVIKEDENTEDTAEEIKSKMDVWLL